MAFAGGVVSPSPGKSMWYRFYKVVDNRPFFCDRDDIKKYDLNQISEETRSGYQWAGTYGTSLLNASQVYMDMTTGLAPRKKWPMTTPRLYHRGNTLVVAGESSGRLESTRFDMRGGGPFRHGCA